MTIETRKPVSHAKLARTALGYALGSFAVTAVLMGGITSHAQTFSGHNSRAPVEYNAGRIELQDNQNRVELSGGVTVTQAGLTVRSNRMLINYTDDGSLNIQRLTATGGVQVSRGNERASGEVAIYDFERRIITMSGNVRLARGNDTLNGERLVIDLASGRSSVDGAPAGARGEGSEGGRVTGSFTVPQDD